jgi:hypothetical protein
MKRSLYERCEGCGNVTIPMTGSREPPHAWLKCNLCGHVNTDAKALRNIIQDALAGEREHLVTEISLDPRLSLRTKMELSMFFNRHDRRIRHGTSSIIPDDEEGESASTRQEGQGSAKGQAGPKG